MLQTLMSQGVQAARKQQQSFGILVDAAIAKDTAA